MGSEPCARVVALAHGSDPDILAFDSKLSAGLEKRGDRSA